MKFGLDSSLFAQATVFLMETKCITSCLDFSQEIHMQTLAEMLFWIPKEEIKNTKSSKSKQFVFIFIFFAFPDNQLKELLSLLKAQFEFHWGCCALELAAIVLYILQCVRVVF